MNKVRFTLTVFVFAVFGLTASSMVQAQATRTWVSGVGDDANPCSRTAPCKTFAGAISKTAAGGEINAIDSGGFGAVTITKSITIDGAGTLAGILNAGTNGININAAGINVTLRNLVLDGAGTGLVGIRIIAANKVSIENCQIFGNNGKGIDDQRIVNNVQLFVHRTIVRNNAGSGIVIRPMSPNTNAIDASLHDVRLIGNAGAGLTASTGSNVTMTNSVVSGNAYGIYVEQPAGATKLFVADTTVSDNNIGIVVGGGTPAVRLSNVIVTDNDTGLSTGGVAIKTFGNNKIDGNVLGNGPFVPALVPVGQQ